MVWTNNHYLIFLRITATWHARFRFVLLHFSWLRIQWICVGSAVDWWTVQSISSLPTHAWWVNKQIIYITTKSLMKRLKGELRWHSYISVVWYSRAGKGWRGWDEVMTSAAAELERRGKLSSGRKVYNSVLKDMELTWLSFPCLEPWSAHQCWTDTCSWKPILKLIPV